MNKIIKPMNPLIWNTAAEFAAVFFDAALSSGIPRGKYVGRGDKPIRMYVKDHIEKFVPLTISYFIEMLKPTSNCTEHMRAEIYSALMDPVNDPELMEAGKAQDQKQHQDILKAAFNKNKMNFDIVPTKAELKSSTVLGG